MFAIPVTKKIMVGINTTEREGKKSLNTSAKGNAIK
jgi:hypothetical protein